MIRAYGLGVITGAFLTAGVIAATPAKADVDRAVIAYTAVFAGAVCTTLDAYPSFDGIEGIGQAIIEDGLTPRQAGQVIGLSVVEVCPRHFGLVRDFIASNRMALT